MKRLFKCACALIVTMAIVLTGCDDNGNGGGSGYTGALITADNLAREARTLYYYVAVCDGSDGNAIQVGSSGANQSWTFPEYSWYGYGELCYVDPDSAPCRSVFPDADRVQAAYYAYYYDQIQYDGCYRIGDFDGYDTTAYSEPKLTMRLPLKMGTEWALVERESYYYYGDTLYWQDSVGYSADAWGTVMTPYDTCTCVRVFVHDLYSEEYSGGPTYREEYIGYFWYDEHGDPLLQAIAYEGDTDPDFHAGYLIVRVPGFVVAQAGLPRYEWDRSLDSLGSRWWPGNKWR